MVRPADIPRARTPEGGWHGAMPAPILAGCHEPLAPGAPDLRGTWRAVAVSVNGEPARADHPMFSHVERIEQAGMRVVVTANGIIHDFLAADGTFENGCHDVTAVDFVTPIVVAGSYEEGVLVLRPEATPGVEVRRWREGDHLVWNYAGAFVVRMGRVDSD